MSLRVTKHQSVHGECASLHKLSLYTRVQRIQIGSSADDDTGDNTDHIGRNSSSDETSGYNSETVVALCKSSDETDDLEQDVNCPPSVKILPPKQEAGIKNETFYSESFNAQLDAGFSTNLVKIANAIESGLVVSSVSDQNKYILTTEGPSGTRSALQTIDFWHKFDFKESKLSFGSFNNVSVVRSGNVPPQVKIEFNDALKTGGERSGQIVLRQSKVPTDCSRVLMEIYMTAYASHYNIGPVLLAAYYLKGDDLPKWESEPPIVRSADAEMNTTAATTVFASVAWDGNCHELLESLLAPHRMTSLERASSFQTFGQLLIDLIARGAEVGLFHGDLKDANVLYLQDSANSKTRLCFTDFDPKTCCIIPPSDRWCSMECIITASVCMFLGFIRCVRGEELWRNVREGLRIPLANALNYKSNYGDVGCGDTQKDSLCSFLNNARLLRTKDLDRQVREAAKDFDRSVKESGQPKPGTRDKLDRLRRRLREMGQLRVEAERNLDDDMKGDIENALGNSGDDYDGQKLLASKVWQKHVAHYMTQGRVYKRVWGVPNEERCLHLNEQEPIYEQVIDYAFGDNPPVGPTGNSNKRKAKSSSGSS